jgi:L-threonylcarbamoyladenylate synthase
MRSFIDGIGYSLKFWEKNYIENYPKILQDITRVRELTHSNYQASLLKYSRCQSKMRTIKENKQAVEEAVKVLQKGGLVIMPTETLYGAMVDATNEKAVRKLSLYKNRPLGKPFSVAVKDMKMAEDYVFLNYAAKALYKKYLPGPLTVISKGKQKVANGVESERGTLGIRIPKYNLVLKVIEKLGRPITATSANASYKKRPYKISDILDNLSAKQKGLIDLIVDAGDLPKNDPSTVIDTTYDDPVVLRQGEIKLKDVVEVLSRSEEDTKNIAKELWQKYEGHYGKRAVIFALEGEMGVGKTQFTKGLGKAMGVSDEVISPTFILESEYDTEKERAALIHIDTWRMQKPEELLELGFNKRILDKKMLAIEWAEKVSNVIREFDEEAIIIWVKIKYGKRENERLISWGVV